MMLFRYFLYLILYSGIKAVGDIGFYDITFKDSIITQQLIVSHSVLDEIIQAASNPKLSSAILPFRMHNKEGIQYTVYIQPSLFYAQATSMYQYIGIFTSQVIIREEFLHQKRILNMFNLGAYLVKIPALEIPIVQHDISSPETPKPAKKVEEDTKDESHIALHSDYWPLASKPVLGPGFKWYPSMSFDSSPYSKYDGERYYMKEYRHLNPFAAQFITETYDTFKSLYWPGEPPRYEREDYFSFMHFFNQAQGFYIPMITKCKSLDEFHSKVYDYFEKYNPFNSNYEEPYTEAKDKVANYETRKREEMSAGYISKFYEYYGIPAIYRTVDFSGLLISNVDYEKPIGKSTSSSIKEAVKNLKRKLLKDVKKEKGKE